MVTLSLSSDTPTLETRYPLAKVTQEWEARGMILSLRPSIRLLRLFKGLLSFTFLVSSFHYQLSIYSNKLYFKFLFTASGVTPSNLSIQLTFFLIPFNLFEFQLNNNHNAIQCFTLPCRCLQQ